MKLNINLKDPKYCDGCPCVENIEHTTFYYCNYLDNGKQGIRPEADNPKTIHLIRPKKCIEENGE